MPLAITAGIWKGRPLSTPTGRPFRPTSSLLRQALFDKLGARVDGSHLLDLFAGSGAISLEALSRGATHAHAVEFSRSSLGVLRRNQLRFSCQSSLRISPKDVFTFLRGSPISPPFDWVFADPPYELLARQGVLENLMQLAAPHIERGGLLFLERGRRIDCNWSLPLWHHSSGSTYGDSCLETFKRL